MRAPLRVVHGGLAVVVLMSAACVADSPIAPADRGDFTPTPSAALIDGSTTGSDDFYFLPPLVSNPTITGAFNPNLLPTLRVCELAGGDCLTGDTTAYFGEGSATVGDGRYQLNWDTDGPETGPIDPAKFYRLEVAVGGEVVGSIDLDPQAPDGPGQSQAAGFYAFRLGETIPVKFWLSTEVLCEGTGYVIECITGAVLDENGGTLAIEGEGDRLSIFLPAGALPGPSHPPITVVIERLDPDAFSAAEGVECIPLFDAPQFGPCFRITTYPELSAALDAPALVSICLDPDALPAVKVTEEQEDQLQIVRFATDGTGDIEALANVTGHCPTTSASLIDVPDRGLFRYAALGVNAIARFVGPQPLAAHGDINLGGLTSSFSRFRFALPGEMTATEGDGVVIQATDTNVVPVEFQVLDATGIPVENAFVHFATNDGTLTITDDSTDADGLVQTTWTVDNASAGVKTMTAFARGLFDASVPSHASNYLFFTETDSITATVVGPPATIAPNPTGTISGTAGESAGTVSITVADAGGVPVAGAAVTWTPSGDGSVTGGATTDAAGTASAAWTLATTAGANTLGVAVGSVTHTFEASGAAGAAAQLMVTGDGQTGYVGSALTNPLSVTVTDQFGNPRAGDAVAWSAADGTITGTSPTDASGTASATWTLGAVPGSQSATATVGALAHNYTATAECFDGYGIANIDGAFGAAEWACAGTDSFQVNISGGTTSATVHWMNDAGNLYMAVRVLQNSFDKANSLLIEFDNDGDGAVALNDDAIEYDADKLAFGDRHVTKKCLNSSQSGCGAGDASVDGAGAAANDGTWTTYELSHPLNGGDPQDIAVAKDDLLGFFLTLRVGKGAQGNTQWPGFRNFKNITIVGM